MALEQPLDLSGISQESEDSSNSEEASSSPTQPCERAAPLMPVQPSEVGGSVVTTEQERVNQVATDNGGCAARAAADEGSTPAMKEEWQGTFTDNGMQGCTATTRQRECGGVPEEEGEQRSDFSPLEMREGTWTPCTEDERSSSDTAAERTSGSFSSGHGSQEVSLSSSQTQDEDGAQEEGQGVDGAGESNVLQGTGDNASPKPGESGGLNCTELQRILTNGASDEAGGTVEQAGNSTADLKSNAPLDFSVSNSHCGGEVASAKAENEQESTEAIDTQTDGVPLEQFGLAEKQIDSAMKAEEATVDGAELTAPLSVTVVQASEAKPGGSMLKSRFAGRFHVAFTCSACEAGFSSVVELTAHVSCHAGLWPVKCEFCVRLFRSPQNLSSHRASAHGVPCTPRGNTSSLCCPLCPKKFAFPTSLKRHQEEMHPKLGAHESDGENVSEGQELSANGAGGGREVDEYEELSWLRPQNFTDPAKAKMWFSSTQILAMSQVEKNEDDKRKSTRLSLAFKERKSSLENNLTATLKLLAEGEHLLSPDVHLAKMDGSSARYPTFRPPPFRYNRSAEGGKVGGASSGAASTASPAGATVGTTAVPGMATATPGVRVARIPHSFSSPITCTKCGTGFLELALLRSHVRACVNVRVRRRYTPRKQSAASDSASSVDDQGSPQRGYSKSSGSKASGSGGFMPKQKVKLSAQDRASEKVKRRPPGSAKVDVASSSQKLPCCPYCKRAFTYLGSLSKHVAFGCIKKGEKVRVSKSSSNTNRLSSKKSNKNANGDKNKSSKHLRQHLTSTTRPNANIFQKALPATQQGKLQASTPGSDRSSAEGASLRVDKWAATTPTTDEDEDADEVRLLKKRGRPPKLRADGASSSSHSSPRNQSPSRTAATGAPWIPPHSKAQDRSFKRKQSAGEREESAHRGERGPPWPERVSVKRKYSSPAANVDKDVKRKHSSGESIKVSDSRESAF
ncbi:PR domain zinc finger protein 2 [Lampetra fluviatilis]